MKILNNRFWQVFLAFAPLILIALAIGGYIFFIFSAIQASESNGHNDEFSPAIGMGLIVMTFFIIVASFISIASLVFYLIHCLKNERLKDGNSQILWAILLFFFSGFAQIFYYFIEINGKPPLNFGNNQNFENRKY